MFCISKINFCFLSEIFQKVTNYPLSLPPPGACIPPFQRPKIQLK
ncbi:MAG: hypothetical protein ACKPKO_56445 [Candidatus Fonsibacter sp.]